MRTYLTLVAAAIAATTNAISLQEAFAQLAPQNDQCSFVHKRLRQDLVSEQTINDFMNQRDRFTDKSFEGTDMVLWKNARASEGDLVIRQNHTIKSLNDAGYTRANGFSLWGENGIDLADMGQGGIGNCWFISGAATMAERPGRIDHIFDNVELNDSGFYQVQMYKLGSPITIQVDDRLPLTENSQTIYAEVSDDGALWGPLLEKAFAKYHGNYDQLVAGVAGRAIGTLTGAPFETIQVKEMGRDELWNYIKEKDTKHFMFNAGSKIGSGNDQVKSTTGIANRHAYTLLGAYIVNGQKLFKMRNPWGSETYKSYWSDNDGVWDKVSESVKAEVGYSKKNDGIFFIPMHIFQNEFSSIDIIFDAQSAHSAHFLRLEDDSSHAGARQVRYQDSNKATAHRFTVKSNVAQTVYITGYVHDERSYPYTKECKPAFQWGGDFHAIKIEGGQYYHTWYEGQKTIKKDMAAGEEAELYTEWAWSRPGISKDFGVTVFGEAGAVSIAHNDGLQSQSWPHRQFDIQGTGAPYTLPTSNVTARDVSAVANKWASRQVWTNCSYNHTWEQSFRGVDDGLVFIAGHRCLTKSAKVTYITPKSQYENLIKTVGSNHSDFKCDVWGQYGGHYSICEVTIKGNEAFAFLAKDGFSRQQWYYYGVQWVDL